MKPPAFQFYADDFIGGTVDLTAEDVGAYIRLLCYQWGRGSIPEAKLAVDRVAGCVVSAEVMAKFENGKNARLEWERQKQAEFREERSRSGKRGATSRWHGSANGSAIKEPMAKGMANDSSPSPSPSPSPVSDLQSPSSNSKEHMGAIAPKPRVRFEKPSIEAVRLAMAKAGLPETEAEKFLNYYEANGWRVGRNPMRSWPHAVGNWKSNYEARRAPKPAGTIWETKQVIEVKQAQANKLKAMHAVEGPLTTEWSDERKRDEYRSLRQDIKRLTERISTAQ